MLFRKKKKESDLIENKNNYFMVFYAIMLENKYNFGVYKTETTDPFINIRDSAIELRDYYEKKLQSYDFTVNLTNILPLTEEQYLFSDAEKK